MPHELAGSSIAQRLEAAWGFSPLRRFIFARLSDPCVLVRLGDFRASIALHEGLEYACSDGMRYKSKSGLGADTKSRPTCERSSSVPLAQAYTLTRVRKQEIRLPTQRGADRCSTPRT